MQTWDTLNIDFFVKFLAKQQHSHIYTSNCSSLHSGRTWMSWTGLALHNRCGQELAGRSSWYCIQTDLISTILYYRNIYLNWNLRLWIFLHRSNIHQGEGVRTSFASLTLHRPISSYNIAIFVVTYVLPLSCMAVCYVRMGRWEGAGQVVAGDDRWWQVVAGDGGWWQVVTGDGKWWQVMAGDGMWWQVVTGGGRWWQAVAGDGRWW